MEKRLLIIFGTVFSMVCLVVGVAGCDTFGGGGGAPDISQSIASWQDIGISVEGVGKVWVTPDVACIDMGVQTQAVSVSAAQTQATQSLNAIITAVKSKGVSDSDIASSNYNISPVYGYDSTGKQVIDGYSVTSSVVVKVREISSVSDVISAAATAGGNSFRLDGVAYFMDNPEQHYANAREIAMNDAAESANKLARLGGVKRGRLIYINETITSNSQTSEIEIVVSVQAVYAIA